ncbi:hypothetical protein [uncultured Acinetobacter sp.]|uniref:hypothetical protein n=1 Tax=uncultured Acinetobacter sp. TaxID=165433 RepID=UPI0025894A13|nr:hypothetical protein [uncultured Acinetobacter sp.]
MDNVIQFPKIKTNNKQEISNVLLHGLVEHGARQEDVEYILERMSNFLDVMCGFELSLNLTKNPKDEDLKLFFKELSNQFSVFRDELLLERFNAESFYLKGD